MDTQSRTKTIENRWSILYRGSLSSCNYACTYCPFAKTKNTRAELQADQAQLVRFVDWVEVQAREIGILFTPWGEGLIRRYYQEQIARLSHMTNVHRVSIQTNLTCTLKWVDACNLEKVALWTTYHPTQIEMPAFLDKCHALYEKGMRFSVGVVGFKEAFEDIAQMRELLPDDVYLWVNAYKREPHYYTEEDLRHIEQIDPLFRYNTRYHWSKQASCHAGDSMFTVDEHGDARRCHFIKDVIGNIYDDDFESNLYRRPCQNERCGCHIGYTHMDQLNLYETFGSGLLERIPDGEIWRNARAKQNAIEQARQMLGEHTSTHPTA